MLEDQNAPPAAPPTEPAAPPQQPPSPAAPPSSDWREAIPPEYRDAPALKDVKDIGNLAKQFVDQSRYLGNSIRIPGEDAGEMGRKEFLAKLQKHAPELIVRPKGDDDAEFWEMVGVPKDVAGYEVEEGVQVPEDVLAQAREFAKELGIPKSKFKQFFTRQREQAAASAKQQADGMAADMASLNQEWGMATEARVNDVKKFAEVMALPESFRTALAEGKVGSDWLKAIHGIIQQFGGMGEGKQVAFQPGGSIPDSPDEVRAKIRDIESHEGFRKVNHPDHRHLVEKRVKLFGQLDAAKQSN
jgi:hypothetical protein